MLSANVNATMFQLRSFVHQRLFAAAEEILGQVERTVMFALEESDRGPHKKGKKSRPLRSPPRVAVPEFQMTDYTFELEDDTQVFSTQEESASILNPAVPEPSGASLYHQGDDNFNIYFKETHPMIPGIKEEQEELGDGGQIPEVMLPSAGIVKEEGKLPIQDSYENEFSTDMIESDDEEMFDSIGEQSTAMNQNADMLQEQTADGNQVAALPCDDQLAKVPQTHGFCHVCGKGFHYIGLLLKHLKTHRLVTDCGLCGQSFKTTKVLLTHLRAFHKDSPFCKACGHTFPDAYSEERHSEICHIRGFTCQACGKTFTSQYEFLNHIRKHKQEKPYFCDICGKSFKMRAQLVMHKLTHSREKSYKCGLCAKSFTAHGFLKEHMKCHSKEKANSCDICGKLFRDKAEMTIHKTMHAEETP